MILSDSCFIDQITQGNSLDLLRTLPEQSVNLVITSPPYFNLRTYTDDEREIGQEESIEDYFDGLIDVMKECDRALRPDGSIVVNLGDRHIDGQIAQIPAQFALFVRKRTRLRFVNELTWVKPNPPPKTTPRRMVPATEPFMHFVKSGDYKFYSERVTKGEDKKANSDTKIGQSYFLEVERSALTEEQKTLARQELSAAIDEVKAGKISGMRMKIRGIHKPAFGGQPGGREYQMRKNGFTIIKFTGRSMLKDYIEMPVAITRGVDHLAMYPQELVEYFVELLTDEGDIVLDPFMGSGTTALAAKALGRRYIGFDLNPAYVEEAQGRLAAMDSEIELEIAA